MSKPEEDDPDFNPWLGLWVADTWWELGRRFMQLSDSNKEKRDVHLKNWSDHVTQKLMQDEMPLAATAVTVKTLDDFFNTLLPLLEKKYEGESISAEVAQLVKRKSDVHLLDKGKYLDHDEPSGYFWAAEYWMLFSDLSPPDENDGWLHAVTRCDACKVFFIKQRINQIYHSEACRVRAANRKSYAKKKADQSKNKRGR